MPHVQRHQGQGDTAFTSDARFVIGASGAERDAVVWNIGTEAESPVGGNRVIPPMCVLPGGRKLGVVEWNHRYNMLGDGRSGSDVLATGRTCGRKAGGKRGETVMTTSVGSM